MSLKQRAVGVFMLLVGCTLAVGLVVGAFRVSADREPESADSSAAVGHTLPTAPAGNNAPGLSIPAR